jgi:ribosome-associated heat shock protein Hsp15
MEQGRYKESSVRIDKWLWAVRIFKTRTKAAEACILNRILINEQPTKPSRLIKPGTKIQIKRAGFTRTLEVLQLVETRIAAKLLADYYKDLTPKEEIDAFKARIARASLYREPGAGRPTKKERRDMDDFLSVVDGLFDE